MLNKSVVHLQKKLQNNKRMMSRYFAKLTKKAAGQHQAEFGKFISDKCQEETG